jgi:hypothetical protein
MCGGYGRPRLTTPVVKLGCLFFDEDAEVEASGDRLSRTLRFAI